ncbi:tripartite tricarboxylate transporter TctB family protein [Devosia sp. PTR5]|uniref:Tripartite tricarboxylate transporter TctB family protein n=1 Tax=Devosia oryzisoli TaxID=2774138 RepID=A0A927ISP2_9HYPH|nr:tripartite tricarboxylate transporter TctB family protein [Devosia oryzisoli]MBD8064968.1 tripartite tricarboxylate transporter TctB family protein [Devosia oryzisoli]
MAFSVSRNDVASGAIFVAFGAYFVLEATKYEFGTPFRMGPGFMPIVLGGILIVLGLAVAAKGFAHADTEEAVPWPWRGLVMVLGTIVFFAATIRGLGFIPVVLISGFVTALSSARNNPLSALAVSVGLCVLCYAIFVVGLGMIVPLFGPWLPL